jgi:hypothetical protein
MIKLLSRLIGVVIILVALYIILNPSLFKNLQTNLGNLPSQANASATVVSQLRTPVAVVSTPVQEAVNPTVVNATPAASATSTSTSSDGSSALTYGNNTNSTFRRLMSQFPDTGVAPPKGSIYDNYTFPRKY